jgi:2-polyprenyl-3-methyl-5-hydroxy-6-metoxy-1,4-benzoquinol methylase
MDARAWDERYAESGLVWSSTPNQFVEAEVAPLPPGRALDLAAGEGRNALWLAERGWQVTAVDFSAAALATGRSLAEAAGADVAGRIAWVEGDLATWTGAPESYDLVVCLYVHIAGPVEEMVGRMASCVAPGGTLFMVGHRPIDPVTGAATAAAGQVQVSVEPALAVLGKDEWEVVVAEDRPRRVAGSGVDAVIRARRR